MQKQADKNHLTVHIVRELKVLGNFNKKSHIIITSTYS